MIQNSKNDQKFQKNPGTIQNAKIPINPEIIQNPGMI